MSGRPVSEEPLMTLAETAGRLGVPVGTFYDWRKHGRGPKGYRLGGKVLFRWTEVEGWLQQQREESLAPMVAVRGRGRAL